MLCVAPAGSGKTTTLVARVAWMVASGVAPAGRICAVTFNKRAAEELRDRLVAALEPLWETVAAAPAHPSAAGAEPAGGPVGAAACPIGAADGPGSRPCPVRVRTFHALGREILADAGQPVDRLVDRGELLRELEGELSGADLQRRDDVFSRLKLDLAVDTARLEREAAEAERAGRPPGPLVRAFLRYEAALAERAAIDFDDLVRLAIRALESDAALLARWRGRCEQLLVDEVQDVDRSQLRLALLLAAPANRVFLVGDDDQTIYAWRLADVRRVLNLAASLPGLRRVDLVTNYRCPPEVVARAVRLVEHNAERFAKTIRAAPNATGRLYLLADGGDDVARARRLLAEWPAGDGETRAVLARTNAELSPFAAVALEAGVPYRAEDDGLLLDDPAIDELLDRARVRATGTALERLQAARVETGTSAVVAASLLAWAAPHATLDALGTAIGAARERRAVLRRDDARLVLATAHGTKGLEFDHVAVGMDEGRFPSARSVRDAEDPERTLEEERRLAYVAWTRARRSLVLLYDPGAPSPFLREAFDEAELAPA